MINLIKKIFITVIVLIYPVFLFAGITGTLSGYVRDKDTGKPLPGANIKIEGTTMGTMADKDGFYTILNIPAGTYDVSASMIGYAKLTIKEVKINVDLETELNFALTSKVLQLKELVVINQRELIQKEITSSTYFIAGQEINHTLPITSFRDAISLLPGVVGGHFRGGRETEVLYLVDGLPIQGAFSRELSSYIPNGSILEMMVQTGGFTSEYGQAASGVVNIVSKDGGDKVEGEVKFSTDLFDAGFNGNDNTRRLEFNVGGPLTIGLGGPIIHAKYFVSADLNLSDTPWRKQMTEAFNSPIFSNYNINSKLSFKIKTNTLVTIQGLVSNWNWHKYNPQWRFNLFGLAQHKQYSHRISSTLTHTFSPKFYASFRYATYQYKREVGGTIDSTGTPNLVFADPNDPTSPILIGNQPWNEQTTERVDFFKVDFVRQFAVNQTLKAGLDFQIYDLKSEALRFTPLLAKHGEGIRYNRAENNFHYDPRFFALYIQNKFDIHGIIANLGLRYDVFNPRISVDQISRSFFEIRPIENPPTVNNKSLSISTLSPRLGVSIPLSDQERLHINYGWYYQMPPLYYAFVNPEYNLNGYFPILGNVELKPVKTIASEFSYKRIISGDLLFMLTGFFKKFSNLVDTQAFLLPENLITSNTPVIGFSRYSNSAKGQSAGFEVILQKRISKKISSRLSYTYMQAKGTSSTAEDGFKSIAFDFPSTQSKQFPLSWDQRHTIVLNTDYKNQGWQLDILLRIFSPLPFTTPDSPTPYNARSSWRGFLDLKVIRETNLLNGKVKPFFEIRNLFNEKAILNRLDDTGVRAYRIFDPTNPDLGGIRIRIGLTLQY
ncbi:MAG: TonB-dependent receptor [Calditrichaeota bacterium]|nr:MAG: TonB-dependent receptor [Calditrichota bacterium]